MNLSYSKLFVFISIALFAIACFFPAFYELRVIDADITVKPIPGWGCLLSGIFVPIALLRLIDCNYNWILIWNANVFYLVSIACFFASKNFRWQMVSIIGAILVGLLFLFVDNPMYGYGINDSACHTIIELGSGYYLWILSFISMSWGIILSFYSNQWKNVRIIFLLSLIGLSICLIYLFSTLERSQSNHISIDEDNRCLTTDNEINKLIVSDGGYSMLLVRKEEKQRVIMLSELSQGFRTVPIGLSNPQCLNFPLKKDKAYSIYNLSHTLEDLDVVEFNLMPDGSVKRIPHVINGENDFYFDIKRQCLVSNDFFEHLLVQNGRYYTGLQRKGIKKNIVGINELYSYFVCDDSLLLYKEPGEYIIDNLSHHNKVKSIKIHVNQSACVDSFSFVRPYE